VSIEDEEDIVTLGTGIRTYLQARGHRDAVVTVLRLAGGFTALCIRGAPSSTRQGVEKLPFIKDRETRIIYR